MRRIDQSTAESDDWRRLDTDLRAEAMLRLNLDATSAAESVIDAYSEVLPTWCGNLDATCSIPEELRAALFEFFRRESSTD